MKRRVLFRITALLSLAFAGTTASAGTIYNLYFDDVFSNMTRPFAPIMPVVIVGTPPGGLEASEVVALLRPPSWSHNTRFRLATPLSVAGGTHLVLAFGSSSAIRLCGDPRGGATAGMLAAARCLGAREVASASMRLWPNRPLSRELGDLLRSLAPSRNPARRTFD